MRARRGIHFRNRSNCIAGTLLLLLPNGFATAQEPTLEASFAAVVRPFLEDHCVDCHNADAMESGIRVDHLTGELPDTRVSLWKGIRKQLNQSAMPPEDALQPTAAARQRVVAWVDRALLEARKRPRPNHGTVRRLTVSQYRHTLRSLLGLTEDLTDILPPDGTTKDGFRNQVQSLSLNPLLIESYWEIAEQTLARVIVDPDVPPVVQSVRVDLGAGLNPQPCPDKLILGAGSHLLANADFIVREPPLQKGFAFEPFRMRRRYTFNEGYSGNATVRGVRHYDSIYHAVFACMRGAGGYPLGLAYEAIPTGLLLRPAIPVSEIFGESTTLGPRANFKVSLRELPHEGNFRVTVRASRYEDGLLLGRREEPRAGSASLHAELGDALAIAAFDVPRAGVYQLDVAHEPPEKTQTLKLSVDGRRFSSELEAPRGDHEAVPFLLIRLPVGPATVLIRYPSLERLRRMTLTPLEEDAALARRFRAFEQRAPWMRAYLGLRRDCGSTLGPIGPAQRVSSSRWESYVFTGAINDFPSPDVQPQNDNYLAGMREIGVRSEYTDGRDMPRMLLQSVAFEGPYYESWPPETHRRIFFESPDAGNPPEYARQILERFATRAYRRPPTSDEVQALYAVWQRSFAGSQDFRQSIQDALLVALTSPQFLFLTEASETPESEDLSLWELASKLSYFLWDGPPDQRLLGLAAADSLHDHLDREVARMIEDERFGKFVREFGSQWLSLDKFDVVSTDRKLYPALTRDAKVSLREEPLETLLLVMRENLPVRQLIDSDFIVANDAVAKYYGLAELSESGTEFRPLFHGQAHLGGLLSQASLLSGLSDGREANPIKRGAWLARKIIASPPEDPPPNVPELSAEDPTLTLREKLTLHREQKGCVKCHEGIDPWGLPFEAFDAGGLWRSDVSIDSRSTLPDATEVKNLRELKQYLAGEQHDRVAYSVLYHLATYAVGRSLTYPETVFLEEEGLQLKSSGYRLQDMMQFIIHSDIFLKK